MQKAKLQSKLEITLNFLIRLLLFLLPWQTIWIYQEKFINGEKWQYGTMGWYGSEILLWLYIFVFVAFVFVKIKDTRYKIQVKPTKDRIFLGSILMFLLYSFASIFWSVDSDVALQSSLRLMEGFFLFLMLYTSSLTFKQMAMWFVAGSILPSILGIVQFLTQHDFSSTLLGLSQHFASTSGTSVVGSQEIGRWLRAYGPFPNPNIFGGYLALVFVVSLMLFEKIKDYYLSYDKLRLKIILYGAIALQISALFFSFSRAGWIAGFIAVLFYCVIGVATQLSPRPSLTEERGETCRVSPSLSQERGQGGELRSRLPPVFLFFVLTTTLTLIFFPLVQTRFAHESVLEIRSTEERVSGYREAIDIFTEHPLFGVGAGNYTAILQKINPLYPGYAYQPVHNVGLLFLTEFGIAGVFLMILISLNFWSFHKLQIINYQSKFFIFHFSFFIILASFDHYLLSSYTGIMMSAVYFSLVFRLSPTNPPFVPKL